MSRPYLNTIGPYIQENKCTIIPYGNLSNTYQNGSSLPIDSMKKGILHTIIASIEEQEATKVLIIQPEGYIPFSTHLESELQTLKMPLTKVLFTPLKEKENPGHEYMRRNNPCSSLDQVAYKKLTPKGNQTFAYLDLSIHKNLLPTTSQYYDYLMLVKNPSYLPIAGTTCCSK